MAAMLQIDDFQVTDEKTQELVERIAVKAQPEEIIVFGSRARGDHRPDSDLDLAVIVGDESPQTRQKVHEAASGRTMSVDLLVIDRAKFDRFRPWINTVERQIDREGVRVYVRGQQSAYPKTA